MTGKLGAIDIGTNSVLLLIAEPVVAGSSELTPVIELATITRLGEGVDRTRTLANAAVERTLACLATYAAVLKEHGVVTLDVVGTSAMRDASGGDAFRAKAGDLLGVVPRVIAGSEEARLTFLGGLAGLKIDEDQSVVVFDIGGGSTEFIRGTRRGGPLGGESLDVGSVRLTERCGHQDRWAAEHVARLDAEIDRALEKVTVRGAGARVVGVAGTTTSLFAIANGVEPYDASRVHGGIMRRDEVLGVFERLASSTQAERERMPGLSAKRADVIVAGARLAHRVLRHLDAAEMIVSDRGVRWGLAHDLAGV